MAQQTDATDDEPTNKQAEYVQQIGRVVVDPEDVLRHFTKNARHKHAGTGYTPRKFHLVGFKNDGVAAIKIGVDPRDDGAYYDSSPHPVWVAPRAFVRGASHDEDGGQHDGIGLPRKGEMRRILREDGMVEAEEGSDEFDEAVEESMAEWEEMWESAVRADLKDELTFEFRAQKHTPDGMETRTITHTVEIEYDDAE